MVRGLKHFRWIWIITGLLPGINLFTASAHPHLFVDVMVKFVLNDTALSGFNVFWEFDEMSSATMADRYDKNHDFKFDKAERSEIESSLPYIANNNFYIFFSWGLKSLKLRNVEQFTPVFRMKTKIMYSFFVACDLSISQIEDEEITLFFDDPSMYTAFQLKKDCAQVTPNKKLTGTISFGKVDYNDCIYLSVKRKE